MNTHIEYVKTNQERSYCFLILVIAFASVFSLFGGVMEPDGALYASIAKNMLLKDDWINLYVRGHDWLDKPHLTFWLAACSFKLFGVSALTYKLPSLLIGWLGSYYLYLLARMLYDRNIALLAVIIYMTAFHIIISNFDVRAEIYLSTFTIAALYHYYLAYKFSAYQIIIGSLYLACAIMVKGIFVVIPIFAGFILYWLFSKQYREFFKIKWWIAITLIGLFILPELYALYAQFDEHPEKIVFNRTGVSGIQFFFWDSQFGRFFNTGPIKGKGDITFFLHTILWAFLPWSFIFYIAVIYNIKKWKKTERSPDLIIKGSALMAFLLFSLSKFQLPHYIIIIFPQFAIMTACYLVRVDVKMLQTLRVLQYVLFGLVIMLLIIIALVFNFEYKFLSIALMVGIAIFTNVLFYKANLRNLVFRSAILSIVFIVFAYGFFYPSLLQYQGGMSAGLWIQEHHPNKQVIAYNAPSFALDFYAPGEVKHAHDIAGLHQNNRPPSLIYIQEEQFSTLKENFKIKILKRFKDYHVTKLTLKFLYYKTRPDRLSTYYLVEIQK